MSQESTKTGIDHYAFEDDSTSLVIEKRSTRQSSRVKARSSAVLENKKVPTTCPVCNKSFASKYHLQRHLKATSCSSSGPQRFQCKYCDKMFTRKDNLREHMRKHSECVELTSRPRHGCDRCDQTYGTRTALRIHVRAAHTNERPYKCSQCDAAFVSSSACAKHQRIHSSDKPYQCPDCSERFNLSSTLKRHRALHTGERPFKCMYCPKSFIQAGGLKAHMFHHTGDNGFKCNQCDMIFNRKSRMQAHVKFIHSKERNYKCEECDKCFIRAEDLRRHQIMHSGRKDFICPTCSKGFSLKSSLKAHMVTHTMEEPRICHECSRAFIRHDCLLRHIRRHHKGTIMENSGQIKTGTATANEEDVDDVIAVSTNQIAEDVDDVIAISTNQIAAENETGESITSDSCSQESSNHELAEAVKASSNIDCVFDQNRFTNSTAVESEDAVVSSTQDEISNNNNVAETTIEQSNSMTVERNGSFENLVWRLLELLVEEGILSGLRKQHNNVNEVLCVVVRRCGETPVSKELYRDEVEQLRENAKLLFASLMDDGTLKTLLNNQPVEEVILHVLETVHVAVL